LIDWKGATIMKASLSLKLEEKMNHNRVPGMGMAVFHKGQMESGVSYGVIEAGTNRKVTADSLFHACSISKMVTAIGVLRLVQEGMLDLDEDVNKYLLSWRVPEKSSQSKKT
jgi:CubicO group peptidase (beta-lactamase class C family)